MQIKMLFLIGAVVSLSDYTAPVYGEESEDEQEESETVIENASNEPVEETEFENTETAAVLTGAFDLADGTYEGSANGFSGKIKVSVEIRNILEKQSTDVDTVSGATYSSRGIIDAVKNALTGETEDAFTIGKGDFDIADGTYTGSAQGYSGTVTVSVKVENRTITAIDIVSQSDTESYFERAKGVIRTILAGQTVKVDAVSGATYSSKGIIEAVSNAMKAAKKGKTDTETQDDTEKLDTSNASSYYGVVVCNPDESGAFTSYNLHVKVMFQNGKIIEVSDVYGDGDSQNDTYITKAVFGSSKHPGVAAQIVKKNGIDGVDTVSGATCTSKAVMHAVEVVAKAAEKDGIYISSGSQNDADDTNNSEDTEKDSENTENNSENTEKDSENTEKNSENTEKDSEDTENNGGNTENGSDSTESGGDTEKNDTENTEDSGGKTLTVVIENDKITEIRDISGDGGKSNSFYIKAASKGVVSQILQKNSTEGIDTVSSATCSSKAIIEACQKALEQAKN